MQNQKYHHRSSQRAALAPLCSPNLSYPALKTGKLFWERTTNTFSQHFGSQTVPSSCTDGVSAP